MALPKKKYVKSRQGKRRSHLKATAPALDTCPQCHSSKLSHRACPTCGTYNGKQIIEVATPGKKG